MPTCCASGCKSRYSRGKKIFSLPRGKDNATRQEVWLQRIGRTDLDPVLSRLCEMHLQVPNVTHCSLFNSLFSSSSSWDADQAVVAALHKRIATLEECLNNMKRKVAALQQQKSRANRRNHELTRNIKKYLSPDQLQGMWTCSMREKQWSTETIQKGLKLRLACGSRGYNATARAEWGSAEDVSRACPAQLPATRDHEGGGRARRREGRNADESPHPRWRTSLLPR
ncbi:hypothetical protein HPB51_023600 [Rhipicephalus microplus]|uniref:THAP-type domain-containing protein n=1 Tax=Rhipicephalus microplus TaxID=6941 RepID=A0A9J6DKA2_RHIMP|nr:hypothetical protein HPB51_023600 [Rhipicephalus microplus]